MVVTGAEVARRVGWALDLTAELGVAMLATRYNDVDLRRVVAGVDVDGAKLPSNGYVAARRLGMKCPDDDRLYLPDRFRRTVEEQVMRRLRQAAWLSGVVDGLIATWPKDARRRTDEEWRALRAVLPPDVDKVTIRNRTRQIANYIETHGTLPAGLLDLEPVATFGVSLLLSAADHQLVTMKRDSDHRLTLRVKLPMVARPLSRGDWSWLELPVALPQHIPANATLHNPTLRLADGRVRVDLPWSSTAPRISRNDHVRSLGYDWGVNTLITASVAALDAGGIHSEGRPLTFHADGATAKVHRLRKQREVLSAKVAQIDRLLTGKPDAALAARRDQCQTEIDFVSRRQTNLNHAIAWAGARWLVDHALASGATAIYGEDLRTMESRGMGRVVNSRCANAVRSELVSAAAHLGERAGLAVVSVPAPGTSANCPRCLSPLRHVKAPNDHTPGHKWALCSTCSLSADRDHAASQRVASRGLAAQNSVFQNRSSGRLECRKAVDVPITPFSLLHRVRLTNPAPATSELTSPKSQRPAGPHPTRRKASEMRAKISQRATCRGFPRSVRATPVASARAVACGI